MYETLKKEKLLEFKNYFQITKAIKFYTLVKIKINKIRKILI